MIEKIVENVYFIGVNDRERAFFDELIPLDCGTSYNSFYVKGDNKTAIIDTMYLPKSDEFLKILDENKITPDYIISNHAEQDHTGVLPILTEKYPNAKIVTNGVCKNNIINFLGVSEDKFIEIKNEETLDLGGKTLKFIMAPGVHFPDTMFCHLIEDNILFTCDFLGAHYTFESVFAKKSEKLEKSAKKYYAEIMMPFRMMANKYTKLVKTINPKIVAPSHGPIYDNPEDILSFYEDWTSDVCHNLVVLPYVSMYGSTKNMIDYIEEKLKNNGIETYKYDILRGNVSEYVTKIVDAKTIILGAPMVLTAAHPVLLNGAVLLNALKPKVKNIGIVGSFGWGGRLVESVENIMPNIRCNKFDPILVKGKPKEEDYKLLDNLVNKIIEAHK